MEISIGSENVDILSFRTKNLRKLYNKILDSNFKDDQILFAREEISLHGISLNKLVQAF